MSRSLPRLAACLTLCLAPLVVGCGRTGLLDGDDGGNRCPPGQVLDRLGRCVPVGDGGGPVDLSRVDFAGVDLTRTEDGGGEGDGGGGDDMELPCQQRREVCNNALDDNCDGLIDCKDPQCAGDKACFKPGQEICNNGVDDDVDGLVDCKDADCERFPGCMKPPMCNPANPDCSDPACVNEPKCKNLVCKPTVDFGVLQKNDSKSSKSVDTTGTVDVAITPCAPGGGGMTVSEFTVAADKTTVRLDFNQGPSGDHVFALFREGIGQKCDANPLGCFDPKSKPTGTTTYTLDKGHYFLIVQSFSKLHQGKVDITLTTPPANKPEICANGVDDNLNGLVDCADPACAADPACKTKQCTPDVVVGALVLGAPRKMATLDTRGGGSDQVISCAGGKGQDRVLQFTLKETAGVLVDWRQTGDHVMALFQKPGPGNNCDAIPLGCYDPSGRRNDTVAWGELPPGDYFFIFQSLRPGNEGVIDLTLSAYRNRKVELCHNAIDDDSDGIIDCADPDCFADPGCGAPICAPSVDLGTLQVGQQASTVVDLSMGAIPNLTVSCSKGGGKAKVVQLTLAKASGMGFQCNQVGDHVLGLFAQAGFRDACDKTEIACGDPKVIPFGCGYIIPNLQPGTYYVIVQAFQAGTEGRVNLTLSSVNDRALEVCNNGKDDDMDGFTDCADRKCAVSPYCSAKACKADETIDPMPINGTPIFKLVQTAGKQVTAQPPCQDTPGGGNAVIALTMPGKGNLKVDYTQVGNHVFAIHPVLGNGLVCEAAKPIACVKSMGPGGAVSFPNLAAGKYWFVVAANKPGDEGSASLRFVATP